MPSILTIASAELGTSLSSNRSKVLEYIRVSGGSQDNPEGRSWCGDFAFWVLSQAKVSPLPSTWQTRPQPLGSNAIPRFLDRFPGTQFPLPGDMYYRPNTDLKRDKEKSAAAGKDVFVGNNTQHVGFVEDPDLKPGFIQSIDGNAGGSNANWSLGMGGGVVSENTTPIAGILGINRFLQVVTEVEIEGRWKVDIGVYTWHYIFLDGGKALCTDIANLTNARYVGTWTSQSNFIEIRWPKTNSVERWNIPLARANHPGATTNGSYSTSATKIQTKKRVAQTTFTENVDP